MEPPVEVQLVQLANQLIFIWSDFEYHPEEFAPAFTAVTRRASTIPEIQTHLRRLDFHPLILHSHDLVKGFLLDNPVAVADFYLVVIATLAGESCLTPEQIETVRRKARELLWEHHFEGRLSDVEKAEYLQQAMETLSRSRENAL